MAAPGSPIFDDQPTASVGSLAVAVSDPNIIYVGSGEGLHRPDLSVGNGIYKSIDAGKTWTHLGLRDGQQIAQVAVDPHNPDHVLVAVAGHPYGPNEERGIFLSTDGGKTFAKTLYKDENIGGADVQFDPQNPQIVYASLWEAREGPWENAAWRGGNGGIFKSTDGGKTWEQLSNGLPNDIMQANLAIAPERAADSDGRGRDAEGGEALSQDDAGATWRSRPTTSARRVGSAAAICRSCGSIRRTRRSFIPPAWFVGNRPTAARPGTAGAARPGGDDYQNVWISPNDPESSRSASDQGAIITVNGGATWSSWYNQSTAQLYHVSADNSFPYRLYSGQQESGSVGIDEPRTER